MKRVLLRLVTATMALTLGTLVSFAAPASAAQSAATKTFVTIQIPDAGAKALSGVSFSDTGVRLVTQLPDQGFKTQQWEFFTGSEPFLFKVRQRSNGGCLQIENDSLSENARITAAGCNAASAEWIVRYLPFPNGSYALINAHSQKAITSPGGASGAQLVQKTFGSASQALKNGQKFVV